MAVTRKGVFWVFEHPEISGKNLTHKNRPTISH